MNYEDVNWYEPTTALPTSMLILLVICAVLYVALRKFDLWK